MKFLPMNFRISSRMTTGKENNNTRSHSLIDSGTMEKVVAKVGTYRITKWRPNDTAIAMRSHGLDHTGTFKIELSSDNAFAALNISIATRTDRDNVDAFIFPLEK
mmetsp:Transcript_4653/g.9296  ORF Transcript_4653/g.9296 Transcript_4653/m.9296 type:complete len:105 (-) Transcript_4653:1038-1352(-)